MKLVIAIVHHDDAGAIVEALLDKEYRTTRFDSAGGFLRRSNATLLVGVEATQVDDVLAILRAHSRPRSEAVDRAGAPGPPRVDLKSAIVFVIDAEGPIRI